MILGAKFTRILAPISLSATMLSQVYVSFGLGDFFSLQVLPKDTRLKFAKCKKLPVGLRKKHLYFKISVDRIV